MTIPSTLVPAKRPRAPLVDKATRNAKLRQWADEIAARVAPIIGLKHTPRCQRITNRRGRGYRHAFSVPYWAAEHADYFAYYVAHEVCHAHPKAERNHGPNFRLLEGVVLAELGMAPVYQKDGRGPYVEALKDLRTGNVLCVRLWPLDPCDPPTVYAEK